MIINGKHSIKEKKERAVSKKPSALTFLACDHYHYKTEPNQENLSKVFSVATNYRFYSRIKIHYQTLFVVKIGFPKCLHVVFFISVSVCNEPIMMNVQDTVM